MAIQPSLVVQSAVRMIDPELGPVVDIPGTIVCDGVRARRGYRLSMFLVAMRFATERQRFAADPVALMAEYGLTAEERGLVERLDYDGMMEYGVTIYALGKAGLALGTDLLGIGTKSRGEAREVFLKRRLGRTDV